MKAYQVTQTTGFRDLKRVDLPEPELPHDGVRIAVRAASLNYRDLIVSKGGYHRNDARPVVPLSDGAGEVLEVGPGVTRFGVGDRVAGCFFTDWVDGDVDEAGLRSSLGGGRDGVLAEQIVLPERAVVATPAYLSDEQAACLPCAAVTAWQALTQAGLRPGQTILTLGTGGVSLFALRLGKAAGARVILTSGSGEKIERAKTLGADDTINYNETPDWHKRVLELTGGVGVDNAIELGGIGTLERSLKSTRVSGTVSLIGVLTGFDDAPPSPMLALFNRITIRGIYVGSTAMFEELNRALHINRIEPVVDRIFGFEEAIAAYEHLASGKHFGKVVVKVA